MSKRFIQIGCTLFMLAALFAVSAQENTTALNNATMNNTTLLNNTALNANTTQVVSMAENETVPGEIEFASAASEIVPVQNETARAQNATQSENVTAVIAPITANPVLQPEAMQIGLPQRTAFAIGAIGKTPNLFSIDGKALAQGAFEVGLPAKTIMDLSALPFFVNKI